MERLIFIQGGLCFFCRQPLPDADASVEHLFALANGGGNSDENCVACCKSINALLGSMSLKEKFQVVLNQKGQFKCPNGAGRPTRVAPVPTPSDSPSPQSPTSNYEFVLANLKNRKESKPQTLKTLTTTIGAIIKPAIPAGEIAALVQRLQTSGKISLSGAKVIYSL